MELLTSTSSSAAAAVLSSDVGTSIDSVWTFVLLALAIPLAFYIIGRIFGLFPGRRARHN